MIRITRILSKLLTMICFWPSKLSTGVGWGGVQNLTTFDPGNRQNAYTYITMFYYRINLFSVSIWIDELIISFKAWLFVKISWETIIFPRKHFNKYRKFFLQAMLKRLLKYVNVILSSSPSQTPTPLKGYRENFTTEKDIQIVQGLIG